VRIVQVNAFHYPFIGGIEHRLHHICSRLGKEHEVFILTSRLPNTKEREEMDGYTVIRLPTRFVNIYNPPYAHISGIGDAIRELKPDLVDLHYRWASSLTRGVLNFQGPKVYTCHNTLGEGVGLTHYMSEINDRLFMRHLPKFARVICVSDYMRRDVAARGFDEDKLVTIYNGVEIPEASLNDGDYVLSLGRIVRLKGLDHLIEAMGTFDGKLKICGDGPDRKRLERLTGKLGLGDRVEFLGRVSEEEKARMMSGCSMFVVPSIHEAYGMVAAEAMSYGKAVIASNTGGLPEVVGDAGVLVPPGDPAALAMAMKDLRGHEKKRKELGQAARGRMDAFSWDEMAKRTAKTYSDILRERATSR